MRHAKAMIAWAIPPLVLILGAALMLFNPQGWGQWLGARLLHLWLALAPNGPPPFAPTFALPAELAALTVLGLGVIVLAWCARLAWAGLFTVTALAAGFYASWLMFVMHRWAVDAATPGLTLILIFLTAAMARAVQMAALRKRLRLAFSDSLPCSVIERVARRPSLLTVEGETRKVTYLVCGIRGLAELTEAHRDAPQEFTELMSRIVSPLMDQALAHGGTIDRRTADGFAAFWNAPLDDTDHALHACEAASGMTVMAARVNENAAATRGLKDKPAPPVEIGVGIATGPVIAGGFGVRGRLGYSVNGDAVILAGRLLALSRLYGPAVIVSGETQKEAARGFAFLQVDTIGAGSTDAPAKLYAMLGNPVQRASPKFRALSTFHDHIFNAMNGQQWEEARNLIDQCRQLSGASQAMYDLHLNRIAYYEKNSPGENWDGAFRPPLK